MTSEDDREPDFFAVPQQYDAIAPEYDASYISPEYLREDRITRDMARRAMGPARKVLDLGCGTGKALEFLGSGREYVGVDISAAMLSLARKNYPKETFVQASVTELPFPDEFFEFAISTYGSLSHLADVGRAMDEVGRVLRPGARVMLMLYGLNRAQRPGARRSEVVNYRLRGVGPERVVAAHLLSVRDVRALASRTFQVERIRGLTVLGPLIASRTRPANRFVESIFNIADVVLCYLKPNFAHTIVVVGSRRKDKTNEVLGSRS